MGGWRVRIDASALITLLLLSVQKPSRQLLPHLEAPRQREMPFRHDVVIMLSFHVTCAVLNSRGRCPLPDEMHTVMVDQSSCIFHNKRGPVRRLCAAAEAAAGTCPRGATAACTCRPHHMYPCPGELQHVCHPGRPRSSPDLAAATTAASAAHCIQVTTPLNFILGRVLY